MGAGTEKSRNSLVFAVGLIKVPCPSHPGFTDPRLILSCTSYPCIFQTLSSFSQLSCKFIFINVQQLH